jgi:hypothetical protein
MRVMSVLFGLVLATSGVSASSGPTPPPRGSERMRNSDERLVMGPFATVAGLAAFLLAVGFRFARRRAAALATAPDDVDA